jgi:hypothetical protein
MLSQEADKYIPELRTEVEEHCPLGEFTKEHLDKLVKLDSFIRESCRMNDFGVGKDYIFTLGHISTKKYAKTSQHS